MAPAEKWTVIHVGHVEIRNFRRLSRVKLTLSPGLNLAFGDNGAGKTSLIEALSLAGRGCGSRLRLRELRGPDGKVWSISASVVPGSDDGTARLHHIAYQAHKRVQEISGAPARNAELARSLPMAGLGPIEHGVINEGPASRLRWIDWAMFHVEPGFLDAWRSFRRALKQRNALLRTGEGGRALRTWTDETARTGVQLTTLRARFIDACQSTLAAKLGELQASGDWTSHFYPGWDGTRGLADILRGNEESDLKAGRTRQGPHRADLVFNRDGALARRHVSRGEEKLSALALLLTMAREVRTANGSTPVLLVDDLPAELSVAAQERVLEGLRGLGGQVIVTSHEIPAALASPPFDAMFHVEHGDIQSHPARSW